jgi:TRAP-type C4-dicarboxylate transport system permease small subunit
MTRVRTLAVILLLAALLFSVTELFDTWDATPQTGNDVEYNFVFVVLCVGTVLTCFRALLFVLDRIRLLCDGSFDLPASELSVPLLPQAAAAGSCCSLRI